MKRISILLTVFVITIMVMPIMTSAQPTGLYVELIGISIENESWAEIAVEVTGVYKISADVYLDDCLVLYAGADFPTNGTSFWGFEIPSGGPGEHEVWILFCGFNYDTLVDEEFELSFGYEIQVSAYSPPYVEEITDIPPVYVWSEDEPDPWSDWDSRYTAYALGLIAVLVLFILVLRRIIDGLLAKIRTEEKKAK